ncbi:hypothetical protein [Mycobacterium sp. URHB0044]|jgi:hypothetical protein|uniref:hypothetical protein n=1 Tax=Mycobacterium sp. URHB0044 TaxID=1380386 RepID=UPI00048D848C|nr:hypothetical protein [Mycobacterium sp. URHB0044]
MRLVADSGLWSTGPTVAESPAVAVLEVSGAVLAWTVDDPSGAARITFTDVHAAEWLWRLVGETGHVAALTALRDGTAEDGRAVDLAGVEPSPDELAALRRIAVGHWLRRWWPASSRDGIVALDPAVLDGEIALLTAAAEDYFADETFDSDVTDLLRPHAASLVPGAHGDDPRVSALVDTCRELADELGLGWSELAVPLIDSARRDHYALAAGPESVRTAALTIASGVGSVNWIAVPPGLFDAADRTVDWSIEIDGAAVVAAVRVATTMPAEGVAVRLRSGAVGGAGVLDADGRATLALVGAEQRQVTETQAWDHDWSATTVTVGADVDASDDAARTRDRVRAFARSRLAQPGPDAFLAEILAAESDY